MAMDEDKSENGQPEFACTPACPKLGAQLYSGFGQIAPASFEHIEFLDVDCRFGPSLPRLTSV
jgi:hypothetical protein